MAYRGSMPFEGPKREADPGIVSDMVRQFADPYALFRELVQNAIDAGAKHIDVTLERDADDTVRTSVADDGSGMTRAIIEGPLLTLFSSSKESDATKIGKYGIGFVSVFAVDPIRVEVRTRRGDEAWLVRLFPDHSFELAKDRTRSADGTTVTIVQKTSGVGYEMHQKRCADALTRWCRFAHVPIVLRDAGSGAPAQPINEPLAVPGLVTVAHTEGTERFVVSAGPAPGRVLCGYYNRGLTLLETNEHPPGLAGVRFAIDSPKLSHTLSRDTVKQDAELRRTLSIVTKLVRGPLRDALAERIAEAAKKQTLEYAALLGAADAHAFAKAEPIVPEAMLVDAIDGVTTMPMNEVVRRSKAEVLFADVSSPMSRALARAGHPVVKGTMFMPFLKRSTSGRGVADIASVWGHASPAEPHPKDDELARAIVATLRAVRRPVVRVLFTTFEGVHADALFRALPADRAEPLASATEAAATEWKKTSALYLGVDHAAVRLARRRALADVRVAAQLLARVILLASGPLEAADVDALLEHAGGARD